MALERLNEYELVRLARNLANQQRWDETAEWREVLLEQDEDGFWISDMELDGSEPLTYWETMLFNGAGVSYHVQ
jgi:hypothetical protein